MKTEVGSYEFKKEGDGWLFKANDPKKLSKKYHDQPRYKAQLDLEKTFKDDLNNSISTSVKMMGKLITSIK